MKCTSCGAVIVDDALTCAYCNNPTTLAQQKRAAEMHADVDARQRRAEEEAERQAKREDFAEDSLRRTAMHSLIWSAVGVVTCCLPVSSVVGLVLAIRARKMAKQYSLVLPMNATMGLWFGMLGLIMAVGLYTFAIMLDVRIDNRIEALRIVAREGEAAPSLDSRTACALAEIRLLTDGYAGKARTVIDDFECPGRVAVSGDHATLEDITFEAGNDNGFKVRGCYKRGTRWVLEHFRINAACDEPEAEPTKDDTP